MKFGDEEPAIIPTAAAIRNTLKEYNHQNRISSDYFDGVVKIRDSIPCYIKEIGYDKFFVHFWTSFQKVIYNKEVKSDILHSEIHFDATGSIIKKAPAELNSTSPVFFYAGLCNGIPVTQMISSHHTTNAVYYWLSQWLKEVQILPCIVVVDDSIVFLQAASLAFNGTSLNIMLDTLYELICNDNINLSLPPVWLRIDCVHVLQIFAKLPCLTGRNKLIKQFYLYTIARIIECQAIEDVCNIFIIICIIALSVINDELCRKCVKSIKQLIAAVDGSVIRSVADELHHEPEFGISNDESGDKPGKKFIALAEKLKERALNEIGQ